MRVIFSALLLLVVINSIAARLQLKDVQPFIDLTTSETKGIWAVLVAGSNDYYNYRHQADVLHAYQLLVSHGVPRNQIITMMYDDIAYSTENPLRGQVFNIPGGPNVYSGVTIDYHRKEVTSNTFLGVLTRNKKMESSGEPVLQSTKKDNVFVYFADHGATGLLSFPNDRLYEDQLLEAFATMRQKEMYNKMVIYVEACEAGSMFQTLSPDDNIYVVTAANAVESSYACLYSETLQTYTGDCFSLNWLLDSDSEDLKQKTLAKQFTLVRNETANSHVTNYGQLSISNDKVGEYQGMKAERTLYNNPRTVKRVKNILANEIPVKQENAEIMALSRKLMKADMDERSQILLKMENIFKTKATIEKILNAIFANIDEDAGILQTVTIRSNEAINFPCYRTVLEHFSEQCKDLIDFGSYDVMRHFYKFSNLCRLSESVENLTNAIDTACAAAY